MSNGAMGKFYEGIMVTGATSDETDALVQSNIVAVGYAAIPPPAVSYLGCFTDGHDGERDLPFCVSYHAWVC